MKIELPDVIFTVEVNYPDDDPSGPEVQIRWDVSVKLAGVALFTRRYCNDRELINHWRKVKAAHAKGEAYDPGPYPRGYAADSDDAKQTCVREFAEHLKNVLGRPDPYARY